VRLGRNAHVPARSGQRRLTGVQAVVLAGGFGTRLRARVSNLPKPMAPVAERPFLEYVLDRLLAAGCERAVLATGHLSEAIEAHFHTRYRELPIGYSHESSPLGTGGAIVRALSMLSDAPTLVLNGDTWLDLDLAAFERWSDARGGADAIVLRSVPDVSRYGSVRVEGERIVAFGEKQAAGAGLINAGIYRLRRQFFARHNLPPVFSIENDLFQPFAATLGLLGYVVDARFIDIGVPEDYDRAQWQLPAWTTPTS
jgi:D-glycero-alpha-D-manno-heptose 1-phosphate guanylyltransferase